MHVWLNDHTVRVIIIGATASPKSMLTSYHYLSPYFKNYKTNISMPESIIVRFVYKILAICPEASGLIKVSGRVVSLHIQYKARLPHLTCISMLNFGCTQTYYVLRIYRRVLINTIACTQKPNSLLFAVIANGRPVQLISGISGK